ncbi:2717_t:CDS:2, partial [Funneliformis geosporum]
MTISQNLQSVQSDKKYSSSQVINWNQKQQAGENSLKFCGNIFFESKYDIVIIDAGVCKSSDPDGNTILGIISYIAPEIFIDKKYTKASDIYSFGMIMWELMAGRRPFWNRKYDQKLVEEIIHGLQPPIVTNAPEGYIELMQSCWHSDSNQRPMSIDIIKFIDKTILNEEKNPTKIIINSCIGPKTTNNTESMTKTIFDGNTGNNSENN